MTEAYFLNKKTRTCEQCFAVSTCKMYAKYKQLELTASGYAKQLGVKFNE